MHIIFCFQMRVEEHWGGGEGGDGDGGVVNAGFFLAKCGQIFISSQLSRNIKFVMYITQTVFFYM